MKSRLITADTPGQLQTQLALFFDEPLQSMKEHWTEFTDEQRPKECNTIHNVQQYITQTIEQNKFHPKIGTQTITYYLLIIYS